MHQCLNAAQGELLADAIASPDSDYKLMPYRERTIGRSR